MQVVEFSLLHRHVLCLNFPIGHTAQIARVSARVNYEVPPLGVPSASAAGKRHVRLRVEGRPRAQHVGKPLARGVDFCNLKKASCEAGKGEI